MQFRKLPLLALASATSAQTTSLIDALNAQNSSLSKLNGLLESSGLASQLNSLTNVTLLAPNNDAINAALQDTNSAAVLGNSGVVSNVLQYHILNGTYNTDSFGNMSHFIATHLIDAAYSNVTGGQRVEGRVEPNGNLTFFTALKQNASVVTANLTFSGGVIHIIDRVLNIPMNATDTLTDANLTSALGAIKMTDLRDAVAMTPDLTVFAPDNSAFNAVGSVVGNLSMEDLTKVLGYHVINGTVAYSTDLDNTTLKAVNGEELKITVENGTVFVNAARVTVPDLLFSNGVIHVIDQVLNPSNTTVSPDPTATTNAPAFSGGTTGTAGVPFTSGITTPSTTFPAATSGGRPASSSSTSNPAAPMRTGAVGAAALFGGAAFLVNI